MPPWLGISATIKCHWNYTKYIYIYIYMYTTQIQLRKNLIIWIK